MTDNLILANKQDIIRIADALRVKENVTTSYDWDTLIAKAIEAIGKKEETPELLPAWKIPEYVKKEAVRVANEVQAKLDKYGEGSVVFISLSDTHLNNDSTTGVGYIAPRNALMAAKILAYALNIDFVIHTGDVTAGRAIDTPDALKTQATTVINMMKEAFNGFPIFCAIGNHDSGEYYDNANGKVGTYMIDGEFLYNNFTMLCNPDESIATNGGYCYKDFPNKNLRVFLLNTSESLVGRATWPTSGADTWNAMSTAQLNQFGTWFNNMPEGYKSIIVSHYPADFMSNRILGNKLQSLIGLTNTEGKFIAQFHGHLHNLLESKMYIYDSNQKVIPTEQWEAYRICSPSGEAGRENSYSNIVLLKDENGNPTLVDTRFGDPAPNLLSKTANTKKDTAFVVNIISPDRNTINSICYGAGYDRTITLRVNSHSIMYNLVNAQVSNAAAYIEEGKNYTTTLTFNKTYKYPTVIITMNGEDITNNVYNKNTGVISINNITGNITITANGIDYINQIPISIDTDGTIFNGTGYISGKRINSSGTVETMSGGHVSGFIPVKEGDIVYMKNVAYNKVATNGVSTSNQRISYYNANKTVIAQANSQSTAVQARVYDGDTLVQFKVQDWSGGDMETAAYFRICAAYIGPDSIITINEPIE